MPLSILIRNDLDEASFALLQEELGSDFSLMLEPDRDKADASPGEPVILIDGRPSATLLDLPSLKHVIVPWAGILPELRENILKRPHLRLYNAHYNAPFVAQHALALLLACTNRLLEADRTLRTGDWRMRYHDDAYSLSLRGKTALLVGYGAIGKTLEPLLKALGMNITVVRREAGDARTYGMGQLAEALAGADAVIVSLPHTPETSGLFDDEAFAAIKQQAVLVNVGRGEVLDQHALYHALKEGRLFAAGLDVWWNYPKGKEAQAQTLPADAPLHELPNLVMSPHRANHTDGEKDALVEDLALTLQAIARGESRNEVSPERGY